MLADCLKRFGLDKFLLFLNMDNAGNCNTTAPALQDLIPTFRGSDARLRCILHILNLIAKAFIQFFFKELKRKKTVKVGAGRGRVTQSSTARGSVTDTVEEITVDDGDRLTPAEREIAETLDSSDGSPVDETLSSQDLHDTQTARSIRAKAVEYMQDEDVEIDADENRQALGLLTKVAGLAKKVHDSGTIAERFNALVDNAKASGSLKTDKSALDRRCPTRWNCDFTCLEAHTILRGPVEQLTATSELKLSSFRLTDAQWKLSEEVTDVLSLFDEMTQYFSQAETPLISDTIGALQDLITALEKVREDEEASNVVRVASCAAVMVAKKYFSLNEDCEVYAIAIVMSPDKKLDWFRNPWMVRGEGQPCEDTGGNALGGNIQQVQLCPSGRTSSVFVNRPSPARSQMEGRPNRPNRSSGRRYNS
ncbi:hypothetical protein C8R47DRAFT_1037152 [Mycena vitilis]|nr:hypothetical protein C8R47DRAFT_1037152 [Mycena vitilis]